VDHIVERARVIETGMRPRPLVLLVALAAISCSDNSEPGGSPVLQSVFWTAGGQQTQAWTMAYGTAASAQPAAAQEVDFVFDRLLDGSRIEDLVTVNGVTMSVPKATPPITVDWPDSATVMSTPPFSDRVLYNSEGFFGMGTSYVFMQPTAVGFPSSDTIVFSLDKTNLTSADGSPMTGPDQISVTTTPFSVSFRLPSAAANAPAYVPSDYLLPALFTNRVGDTTTLAPFVSATAGGVALPVALAPDASDPTVVYVSAAACVGSWPTGVPIDVTIAAGAPDAFGVPMAAEAHAMFQAVGATVAAPDGGCGPRDAGTD
jgi:hypothetical protein